MPPKQGRSMIKMNCVLLTACIVLLAFSSSGEYNGGSLLMECYDNV